ncbi:GTPase HflX [bacterium]|nr:GTPase HflX [candidate division CSSED10-310 bacterium]
MQRATNHIDSLVGRMLPKDRVFDFAGWRETSGVARAMGQCIAVYINRRGSIVAAVQGEGEPPGRILPHPGRYRLSGIRAVLFLPAREEFPRPRDVLFMLHHRLDLMVGIAPDTTITLVIPGTRNGDLFDGAEDIRTLTPDELRRLELAPLVAAVRTGLVVPSTIRIERGTRPRAMLVGISSPGRGEVIRGNSLTELKRLCETAGFEPAVTVRQNLRKPSAGFFIGKGKAEEIRRQVLDQDLDGVILSEDIKYTQKRNLKSLLGVPVMDRTDLILRIFSQHASTEEGRLQVRMAMINQHLRQMVKEQRFLDRPGAGIGTRGPGETSQEMKRRLIFKRKQELETRLAKLAIQRELRRKRRDAAGAQRVALVGYTNAGKSSLLNALSGAHIESADKLFTTLETRTRRVTIAPGVEILMSDTVGFIKDLPHHLIHAFHSTLEEALDADLLCVVADAADPHLPDHLNTIDHTLSLLDADHLPHIMLLNKLDLLDEERLEQLRLDFPGALFISTMDRRGLDSLGAELSDFFLHVQAPSELFIPYSSGRLLDDVHQHGRVLHQAFENLGVRIRVVLNEQNRRRYAAFLDTGESPQVGVG